MMASSLIDAILERINQEYHPGTFPWMKANRTDDWGNMLTLEGRVNEMALGSDTEGLREALSEYQSLILTMVREFRTIKEATEQGSFNFVERP